MPEFLEIVAMPDAGMEALPTPEMPYYVHAQEGYFLYRETQIGTVLVLDKTVKPNVGKLGFPKGIFNWTAPRIPGSIISQAHDFFKRIYTKYNSEAEVLITMHNDTKAFRLFVPYQRVSGAGVKSAYEPTHIHKDYTVVGTIHSHCNFSAFHSGTDSDDASDMDGVHFTIGHNMREIPEIVAMVAMNGEEFHYKDPSNIADIVYKENTAPAWWDDYVFPASAPAAKPKGLKSLTEAQWDEFRGLVQKKQKAHVTAVSTWSGNPHNANPWGFDIASENGRAWKNGWNRPAPTLSYVPTKETMDFNRNQGRKGTEDWSLILDVTEMGIQTGIFNDKDFNKEPYTAQGIRDYWSDLLISRIEAGLDLLDSLGVVVNFEMKTEATPDER